ncbi:MAG: D-aminoacyl-tRNA deacylase [Candidatus Thermoplasmatota archaeon]|nr:transposase [Euryarchaeota archaeon]MBU4032554.1 D-aminoacyl-tRNA deacylase [Candidatus Thermoplasmatota archaeon]MBU4072027.1 D-aminoacyl-tRNA deacylase [Candidatus Thermoplasmatota archaeon]MBU4144558.1 D-aminoacyl-tRNA deacylase [Candidatus Thermoplasmatota archaeon]MBU4592107.1 D-aminoacyl-tRNA deacylase [Candidatus Thermoplasmatota archaeon]
MHLIITSAEDVASMNIRGKLLGMAEWEETGIFEDEPVLSHGNFHMILIKDIHLHRECLDRDVENDTGNRYDTFIFASRHRSESGLRTLTVHALGNYGNADFGGEPGRLVPTNPMLMTEALLLLKKHGSGLDFGISFETTHHGPYLETPTLFIEIGSGPEAWPEPEPAKAIARVILELGQSNITGNDVVGIGFGGGHYAPRHTDVVERMKISMGHMVPDYAIAHVDGTMLDQIIERTPGASVAYFHKKAVKQPRKGELTVLLEERNIRVVRSADLEPRH